MQKLQGSLMSDLQYSKHKNTIALKHAWLKKE